MTARFNLNEASLFLPITDDNKEVVKLLKDSWDSISDSMLPGFLELLSKLQAKRNATPKVGEVYKQQYKDGCFQAYVLLVCIDPDLFCIDTGNGTVYKSKFEEYVYTEGKLHLVGIVYITLEHLKKYPEQLVYVTDSMDTLKLLMSHGRLASTDVRHNFN